MHTCASVRHASPSSTIAVVSPSRRADGETTAIVDEGEAWRTEAQVCIHDHGSKSLGRYRGWTWRRWWCFVASRRFASSVLGSTCKLDGGHRRSRRRGWRRDACGQCRAASKRSEGEKQCG